MMKQLASFLFTNQDRYTHPLARQQARIVLVLLWAVLVVWSVVLITPQISTVNISTSLTLILTAIVSLYIALTFTLLKRQTLRWAMYVTVGFLLALSLSALFFIQAGGPFSITLLFLPIVAAGVLLKPQGIVTVGVSLVVTLLLFVLVRPSAFSELTPTPLSSAVRLSIIFGMAVLILAISAGRYQDFTADLSGQAQQLRQFLLQDAPLTPSAEANHVYQDSLRSLRTLFGFDEVQIYLIDREGNFTGRVRSGVRSTEKLNAADRLSLKSASAVSEAARLRQVVQVSAQEGASRAAYLLPSMTRGVAVPLLHEDRLVGVVDIQNVQREVLTDDELILLRSLAGRLASKIVTLHHINRLRADLEEQQAVLSRMQAQISDVQAIRQDFIGAAWDDYVGQRGEERLGFDWQGGRVTQAADLPPAMRAALQAGRPYVTEDEDERLINVPIEVRGDVLGAMSFSIPPGQIVTERQLDLAATVAQRLGSALESNRLLEQTQQQARRERQATEVANLFTGVTDVDSLLRLAADALNDRLGGVQTQITIEPNALTRLPQSPAPRNGNSNGDHA